MSSLSRDWKRSTHIHTQDLDLDLALDLGPGSWVLGPNSGWWLSYLSKKLVLVVALVEVLVEVLVVAANTQRQRHSIY